VRKTKKKSKERRGLKKKNEYKNDKETKKGSN
jgi:hypothetical protein